jgi:transglutaminase-like putative cysteine protease
MSIKAAIYHLTHYKYDRPVFLQPQIIRLQPAPQSKTKVLSHSLQGLARRPFRQPAAGPLRQLAEPARVSRAGHGAQDRGRPRRRHDGLQPLRLLRRGEAETWPFTTPRTLREDLSIYMKPQPAGPLLQRFLAGIDRTPQNTVNFVTALNARVQQRDRLHRAARDRRVRARRDAAAAPRALPGFGWLLVQALRHLGFAARFVSGYLIQLKPDLVSLDGPSGTDHDFTDLHAWCEVYLPGAGWIGLDPTSGLLTGESHIPLAATPHYRNAAPITGFTSFANVEFAFDMKVSRVAEHPRITKPFSDESWERLNALGRRGGRGTREAADVRLTMGGEPTFVSIDDFEAGEWNADAVGPTKRAKADALIRRLRERFAPGGLLHYGQGKWYPGETLPRWTFSLYWRRDGKPVWQREDLVAAKASSTPPSPATRRGCSTPSPPISASERRPSTPPTRTPATGWSRKPGCPQCRPGQPRARRCRGAGPHGAGVRARPDNATGYVLPVQRWNALGPRNRAGSPRSGRRGAASCSSPPATRRSAIACRSVRCGTSMPTSLSACRAARPDGRSGPCPRSELLAGGGADRAPTPSPRPSRPTPRPSSRSTSRCSTRSTATCAPRSRWNCARGGSACSCRRSRRSRTISNSSPPPNEAARSIDLPIQIEGYAPPYDPRLNVIRVAPDPGVIEVNIHPASSWEECVATTTAVYEEARQARLGADKFMIDGKHTGTGGGNHVVVGGATPSDSPFLRRPDLLKSLVLHWQRHPSLSYLFSGLFIGPTSQAPRVDEARHDSLYELEIALRRCRHPAKARRRCPGWSTGCSATCSSTSPATRTAPRSASTSSIRRTARPAGSDWSSSAASRCRPMRG